MYQFGLNTLTNSKAAGGGKNLPLPMVTKKFFYLTLGPQGENFIVNFYGMYDSL